MADTIGDVELREIWERTVRSVNLRVVDIKSEDDVWRALHNARVETDFGSQVETLLEHNFPSEVWERILVHDVEEVDDIEVQLRLLEEKLDGIEYDLDVSIRLEEDLRLERDVPLERRLALERDIAVEVDVGIDREVEKERIFMTLNAIRDLREEKKLTKKQRDVLLEDRVDILKFIPVRK